MHISIANIELDVSGYTNDMTWLLPFRSANVCSPVYSYLYFNTTNCITKINGTDIYKERNFIWRRLDDGYEVLLTNADHSVYIGQLVADRQWKEIHISMHSSYSNGIYKTLAEIAFRNILLQNEGLILHASSVNYAGNGLAFSGPSGIGKSTHAALWTKYRNSTLINEDRPAIRINDSGEGIIYSTPWAGSAHAPNNINSFLKAIVFLEQSKTNNCWPILRKEYVRKLSQRLFLPYYCESKTHLALDVASKIIDSIPAYSLECNTNQNATDIVINTLGI